MTGWSTIDKVIKVVAMLPNIIGSAGDSINERQLIKFLRKYCDVVTYSLLPISNIGRLFDKSSLSLIERRKVKATTTSHRLSIYYRFTGRSVL
ncbi:MAG: hypothetical protein QXF82_05435 [Nitrososphaeria archaeon]